MLLQECANCGAKDLYEQDGYFVCRYCNSKHLISQSDRPTLHTTISLKSDAERLLQKCKDDPANAERYAKVILEIDPNNSEAKRYLKKDSIVGKEGCYIATAVYGSYDCPPVWVLRRYRDTILAATWYGRLFIRIYYRVSPALVRLFGETKWIKCVGKAYLDRLTNRLQGRGFDNTPYQDRTV